MAVTDPCEAKINFLAWTSINQHDAHLAKGLEFRTVAVMACDDEVIPLKELPNNPVALWALRPAEAHIAGRGVWGAELCDSVDGAAVVTPHRRTTRTTTRMPRRSSAPSLAAPLSQNLGLEPDRELEMNSACTLLI